MKKVIINSDFVDRETGKVRKAGKTVELPDERVEEIKSVNPDLITVIGTVAEKKDDKKVPEKTDK